MKRMFVSLLLVLFIASCGVASPLIYRGILTVTGLGQTQAINVGRASHVRVFIKRLSLMSTPPEHAWASIVGVADLDFFFMASDKCSDLECSLVAETPSEQIKVQISGTGKFRIYVWGS